MTHLCDNIIPILSIVIAGVGDGFGLVGHALKGSASAAAKKGSEDPNDFFKERLLKPLPDFGGNRCSFATVSLFCFVCLVINFCAVSVSCGTLLHRCSGTYGLQTLTCGGVTWLPPTTPNAF
jgi:hypothetical protein